MWNFIKHPPRNCEFDMFISDNALYCLSICFVVAKYAQNRIHFKIKFRSYTGGFNLAVYIGFIDAENTVKFETEFRLYIGQSQLNLNN